MQQHGLQLHLVAVSICVRQSHAAKADAGAAAAVAEGIRAGIREGWGAATGTTVGTIPS